MQKTHRYPKNNPFFGYFRGTIGGGQGSSFMIRAIYYAKLKKIKNPTAEDLTK